MAEQTGPRSMPDCPLPLRRIPSPWQSTNGGTSWRNLLPSSSTNVYAVIGDPQDPTVVYAATDTGVVKSTDSGASWTPIPGSPGFTQVLAFDPQDANTLYAAGPAG